MKSCREIVRLVNAPEERPLMVRMELKMHLMMCRYCRRYRKHLEAIHQAFLKMIGREERPEDITQLEEIVIRRHLRSA